MNDRAKADIYLKLLDEILSGKDTSGPIEDKELADLIKLAKSMVAGNLQLNKRIGEELKDRILLKLTKGMETASTRNDLDTGELEEEDLDRVAAAGFIGSRDKKNSTCPYCGAPFNAITGKCSNCNR